MGADLFFFWLQAPNSNRTSRFLRSNQISPAMSREFGERHMKSKAVRGVFKQKALVALAPNPQLLTPPPQNLI